MKENSPLSKQRQIHTVGNSTPYQNNHSFRRIDRRIFYFELTRCLQYRIVYNIIHLLKGGVERAQSEAIYSSPHKFFFKETSRN